MVSEKKYDKIQDSLEIYRNEENSFSSNHFPSGDTTTDYYTLVLHQSINFTKCFVVSNLNGELITYHEEENNLIIKKDGYKELVPEELYINATKCMKCAIDNFKSLDYNVSKVVCMSICTHRNIVVVWSNKTGRSLYNALPEDDSRCDDTCQKLIQKSWRKSLTNFQHLCGLPISAKWTGVKLRWLLDNIGAVQEAYRTGDLRMGTLDSWLVWHLTGGTVYATDVTNASYTMLMNLHRYSWDSSICKFIELDPAMLPDILSCTEMFGRISGDSVSGMGGLAITGLVCDTKAALIGQQGTQPASISLHIDTGGGPSNLTIAVGEELLFYRHVLKGVGYVLSTATFQFGCKGSANYSLEATLYNGYNLLPWFRDCLRAVTGPDDIDGVANTVTDCNGCFFIPTTGASHGPLDRSRYRHVNLWGMSLSGCRPGHIVRAALESVAVEVANVLSSVAGVVGRPYESIGVGGSGGLERSDVWCQLLADLTGLRVERLAMSEPVILGGALLAVVGANLDPSGLQAPLKERFSCLVAPGDRRKRCRLWLGLASEQELLDHRFWIGGSDDDNDSSSLSNNAMIGIDRLRAADRNKKYSLLQGSNHHWSLRLLSVFMIGTPFTLLGFGAALALIASGNHHRFHFHWRWPSIFK